MLATGVKLSKSKLARWPARCIRCGTPPTTKLRVYTHAIGWWTALFAFGSRFTVEVPSCEPCKRKVLWQRRIRFVVMMVFLVVGVIVAGRVLDSTRGLRIWLAALIALGVALPWILWEVLVPRVVELTAYSNDVKYEFADREYAEEFAALNDAEISD